MIKNIIKDTNDSVNFADKNMLWEYLKWEIWSNTILYAGEEARENAKIEKNHLEILEKNLNDSNYTEYLQLKGEWEGLHLKKTQWHTTKGKSIMGRIWWKEY